MSDSQRGAIETTRPRLPEARRVPIKLIEGPGHLPIHQQIKYNLSYAIGTGQLGPGSQLPSVRELAAELQLAPNTVARAYQELQDEGLLVTQSGRGTFVSDLIDEPGRSRRAICRCGASWSRRSPRLAPSGTTRQLSATQWQISWPALRSGSV